MRLATPSNGTCVTTSGSLGGGSRAVCAVGPLSLLMPLMVVRTVGFLTRSMPAPFDNKRIPNFQPFLDRLTLDTYAEVKALQRCWVDGGVANVRANMLCVALLITQIDLLFVKRLLVEDRTLLQAMDVEGIIGVLDSWHHEKYLRSRFVPMHRCKLKSLLRSFATVTVPQLTVPEFVEWLQRKEGAIKKVKVFDGCGPFVPMVMARELVLYGFFPVVGSLASLGKGQGSSKFFGELGLGAAEAMRQMRDGFESAALDAWTAHLQLHPGDARHADGIKALLFRSPTVFELENMACEGKKMLKVIKHEIGLFGDATVGFKSFHATLANGKPKSAPPMDAIPLPRMVGEAMVVDEIALLSA